MADFWKMGAMVTMFGWFLAPVITLLVNKLFAYLSVDLDQKLRELNVFSMPELRKMLKDVQEQRIITRAAKKDMRPEPDDLQVLNDLAKDLRLALHDAEDILDLVDYYKIEKEVLRDRSVWEKLMHKFHLRFDHLDEQLLPLWSWLRAPEQQQEPQQPTSDPEAPENRQEEQTSSDLQARHQLRNCSLNSTSQRLHSYFLATYNCCGSILRWLLDVIQGLNRYRDWSYEVVGIIHNKHPPRRSAARPGTATAHAKHAVASARARTGAPGGALSTAKFTTPRRLARREARRPAARDLRRKKLLAAASSRAVPRPDLRLRQPPTRATSRPRAKQHPPQHSVALAEVAT